jgi:ParB family chromosome partitioning protein
MPLGKSLSNILGDYFGPDQVQLNNPIDENFSSAPVSGVQAIPIKLIQDNPFQTRTYFEEDKIASLARNIKENGLIQPIVVLRKVVQKKAAKENISTLKAKLNSLNADGTAVVEEPVSTKETIFILLAGERRLRACKSLGWNEILAMVKEENELSSDQQALLSAMENLQREDLSPIELANTLVMLMQTQKLDETGISELINRSQQYVKNHLRLLTLDPVVQKALIERQIGEGQARHLVGLTPELQQRILKVILEKSLTVKEIARLVQNLSESQNAAPLPFKSLGHKIPPETMKKFITLAESFPKARLRCLGDENKGKIVITWGE